MSPMTPPENVRELLQSHGIDLRSSILRELEKKIVSLITAAKAESYEKGYQEGVKAMEAAVTSYLDNMQVEFDVSPAKMMRHIHERLDADQLINPQGEEK